MTRIRHAIDPRPEFFFFVQAEGERDDPQDLFAEENPDGLWLTMCVGSEGIGGVAVSEQWDGSRSDYKHGRKPNRA